MSSFRFPLFRQHNRNHQTSRRKCSLCWFPSPHRADIDLSPDWTTDPFHAPAANNWTVNPPLPGSASQFQLVCAVLIECPADETLAVLKQVTGATHREQEQKRLCPSEKDGSDCSVSSEGCVRGPAHRVPPQRPRTGQGDSQHLLTPPVQHIPDHQGNKPTCPTYSPYVMAMTWQKRELEEQFSSTQANFYCVFWKFSSNSSASLSDIIRCNNSVLSTLIPYPPWEHSNTA